MKTDIVINYGVGLVQLNTGKNVTHKVTSIRVNSDSHMVTIVYERKLKKVDYINISMGKAQEIGFINLDALKPLLEK